jgi:hypothetical protein
MEDVRAVKEAIRSYPEGDKYKYWLNIDDSMKEGSLRRAKALIRVLPATPFSGVHGFMRSPGEAVQGSNR